MSTFEPRTVACRCGAALEVRIGRGIHAPRLPHVRQQILDGELHRFRCDACGETVAVEAALVYTDFPRGHYVAVELPGADPAAAVARHRAIFDGSFAPEPARAIARELRRRVVFGRAELRDKLLAWEHGYDDYVVEAVKADLIATADAAAPVHVVDASADGLVLRDAGGEVWPITRAVYAARASDRDAIAHDYPALADDWHVAAAV